MPRNSFIQMTKLHNVRGRIYYISSPKKQENLYAVYETTDRNFWTDLAKYNQAEFKKNGTEGKCIEAFRQLLAGRSADRDDPAGPPERTAVERQDEKPFGKRIEMRIAQEIEIRDRHHRRHAPQMHRQRQRRPKAVVEVNAIIHLCANDIFMLRSVARQHAGEVLEVSPAECGGSRVESYFHNLILKNWSICQIIVIFIE